MAEQRNSQHRDDRAKTVPMEENRRVSFAPAAPAPENDRELAPLPVFSENYRGDRNLPSNMPANVPEHENCAVFITGLPATINTRELLAHIRETGRVWQSHINPSNGQHNFAAAKVTFFVRAAAENFVNATRNGFFVGGDQAHVSYNRHKVRSQPMGVYKSRVLIVRGNPTWVNLPDLLAIVQTTLRFWDLDEHFTRQIAEDEVEITMQFGSFRAQAESAHIVLNRRLGRLGVTFTFGPDPCGLI
ncbi:hypothetical protein B0H67DRAFT_641407 [Lasiosphaeris hirsuta]|uniref:RRM domain-containing protein n=1 Tax=Lasiosphaeris hirsuta TaxID=260670 RepID=A0AA40AZM3_9PEZI|nr:hypothetical protein B0H67DRAFT_641407 [Lasiosphaeris hirsuta]